MIRTGQQIQDVLDRNPFLLDEKHETERLFVAFLNEAPNSHLIEEMSKIDYSPEEYAIDEELKGIYFYVPYFAKYKLDTTLFEKKLKVWATSRNWRTTTKLGELVKELSVAKATVRDGKDESSSSKKSTAAGSSVTEKATRQSKRRRS